MWTWHKETSRGWAMTAELQYAWCRYWHEKGYDVLSDIFATPQGWFLTMLWDWRGRGANSYEMHIIEDGHFVGVWPLTFDEFEGFPLMAPGFFIPF